MRTCSEHYELGYGLWACACVRACLRFCVTLLADILHGGDELLLQVLAVLGDLLSLLQEVLRGLLHGHGQHVGFLRAALLFTGRAFVTGVHQSGHL